MKTYNERLNTAKAVGGNGVNYVATGSDYFTGGGMGWYGFVVNEDAVVGAVVLNDNQGNTVSLTPSWIGKTLAAGMWIPFGVHLTNDIYATGVGVTSGSILLYRD